MRYLLGASVFGFALSCAAQAEVKNPLSDQGSWPEIKEYVIGPAAIQPGQTLFSLTAPYRAQDAAIVPILLEQTDHSLRIHALDLVVDENPAPVVAHIDFGPAMHPLLFETNVRVNLYSNVRALAHSDGSVFMNGRFVKASGGCSAPAGNDPDLALADMGQMRLRNRDMKPAIAGQRREVQVMIRHPNYSGLQRDQITQLFITAHFIDTLEVWQGSDRLFALTGGISISENPVFRFAFTDNGSGSLRIRASDTDGNIFNKTLPLSF